MPDDLLPVLVVAFLVVGALYASVGHAGASGYLAVMTLVGVEPILMRPIALLINILVATIASAQFAAAGHFSWRLFWPLALGSIPAAFAGAALPVHASVLRVAIGIVLLLAAAQMVHSVLGMSVPAATKNETIPCRPPAAGTALLTGSGIGLVAGMTGTGGGIFLSPLMLLLRWADAHRTAATAGPFILCNSLAGLVGVTWSGWKPSMPVAWLIAAACAGGTLGAWAGSHLMSPHTLRLMLAPVLLVAAAKLMFG